MLNGLQIGQLNYKLITHAGNHKIVSLKCVVMRYNPDSRYLGSGYIPDRNQTSNKRFCTHLPLRRRIIDKVQVKNCTHYNYTLGVLQEQIFIAIVQSQQALEHTGRYGTINRIETIFSLFFLTIVKSDIWNIGGSVLKPVTATSSFLSMLMDILLRYGRGCS